MGCARDEEGAFRRIAPFLMEKYKSYFSWGLEGLTLDPKAPPEAQLRSLAADRFAVGTPAQVTDALVAQHRAGITHLAMRVSWPGMGHNDILAGIEMSGAKSCPKCGEGRVVRYRERRSESFRSYRRSAVTNGEW